MTFKLPRFRDWCPITIWLHLPGDFIDKGHLLAPWTYTLAVDWLNIDWRTWIRCWSDDLTITKINIGSDFGGRVWQGTTILHHWCCMCLHLFQIFLMWKSLLKGTPNAAFGMGSIRRRKKTLFVEVQKPPPSINNSNDNHGTLVVCYGIYLHSTQLRTQKCDFFRRRRKREGKKFHGLPQSFELENNFLLKAHASNPRFHWKIYEMEDPMLFWLTWYCLFCQV